MSILDSHIFKFKKPQVFLLVVLLLFIISCGNKIEDLPNAEVNIQDNDRAENVSFIFSKNGKTNATIDADEFIRNDYSNPKYVDLKDNIVAEFYNDSLVVDSKLTAAFGRFYPESGNIIVRDSVVVINKKGDQLETEKLIWNEKIKRFYTEEKVKITMDEQVTYGEGMEANQDFSYIKIKNQTGIIPVDKGDLPTE